MAEPCGAVKKRRRWPWAILVVVLLLVGGAAAWRFRPLNPAEREFVGHWVNDADVKLRFLPDRRVILEDGTVGSWSATDRNLSVRFPVAFSDYSGLPWSARIPEYLDALLITPPTEVAWHSTRRFSYDGHEFIRLPE